MAFPLLLALGLGVRGFQGLQARNQQQQTQQANQSALSAFLGGTPAGPLPVGQAGPPQPAGIGGQDLNAQQIATVQALAQGGPGQAASALDLALKFQTANLAQQQQMNVASRNQANVDFQREKFGFEQFKFATQQQTAINAQTTTANDLQTRMDALTNPQAGAALAALENRDTFAQFDELTGGFRDVARLGTKRGDTLVGGLRDATGTLERVNELVDIFDSGSIQQTNSAEGARQQISYQFALGELRKLLGTGTPQAAELELFAKTFPDPQSLQVALARGDPAGLAAWQKVQEIARDTLGQASRDTRLMNLDPRDAAAAEQALNRSQETGSFNNPPAGLELDPATGAPVQGAPADQQVFGPAQGDPSQRSQLSTQAALRTAELMELFGFGTPGTAENLRKQREAQIQAGAPIFGGSIGPAAGFITDTLSDVTGSINIFR